MVLARLTQGCGGDVRHMGLGVKAVALGLGQTWCMSRLLGALLLCSRSWIDLFELPLLICNIYLLLGAHKGALCCGVSTGRLELGNETFARIDAPPLVF